LSGLQLARKDGVTLVDLVEDGSAAAAQGVKVGDVIRKVGSAEAGQLSLFEINTLFSAPDTVVRLGILRGQKRKTIDLPLREK
jgi:S1-C subfamily serine protease